MKNKKKEVFSSKKSILKKVTDLDSTETKLKWKWWIISSLITLCLIELLSPVIYQKQTRTAFSRSRIQSQIGELTHANNFANLKTQKEYMGIHVLHPYQGYVKNKEVKKFANEYGMIGGQPILKKSQDNFNIVITGGSVALHFFNHSKDYLIGLLKQSPKFQNKNIQFVSLALEGFKQPQQLMSLNYFQFLGAEYDAVINLDGYNDLVLPYSENSQNNVFPFFPRSWQYYSSKSLNTEAVAQLGKINVIKHKQISKANFFSSSPLNLSNFCLTLWGLQNKKLESEIIIESKKLDEIYRKSKPSGFQALGPQINYKTNADLFKKIIDAWAQASLQMKLITEGQGGKYFHFLQPNQYFPNSKKLSPDENEIANIYSIPKEQGLKKMDYYNANTVKSLYSRLIKKGKEIQNKDNVFFTDLTKVFHDVEETVYIDQCCHINKQGNNILAQKIANTILSSFLNLQETIN